MYSTSGDSKEKYGHNDDPHSPQTSFPQTCPAARWQDKVPGLEGAFSESGANNRDPSSGGGVRAHCGGKMEKQQAERKGNQDFGAGTSEVLKIEVNEENGVSRALC